MRFCCWASLRFFAKCTRIVVEPWQLRASCKVSALQEVEIKKKHARYNCSHKFSFAFHHSIIRAICINFINSLLLEMSNFFIALAFDWQLVLTALLFRAAISHREYPCTNKYSTSHSWRRVLRPPLQVSRRMALILLEMKVASLLLIT